MSLSPDERQALREGAMKAPTSYWVPAAGGGVRFPADSPAEVYAHIANFSPNVAIALLSDLEAAEAKLDAVTRERDEARAIVRDIYWMALRYADGRMTYAVGMVNDAVGKAYAGGWVTPKDVGGDPVTPRFARDGMSAEWRDITARVEAAEARASRLTEALAWVATYEPEHVAAAEEKFGLTQQEHSDAQG